MAKVNPEDVHQMSPRRIRLRASLFHVGNIVCMLAAVGAGVAHLLDIGLLGTVLSVALILPTILWFGASMALYSFFAEDPHELVSHHTQRAGYFFYGGTGAGLTTIAFLQTVPIGYLLPIPTVVVAVVLLFAIKDLVAIFRTDLDELVPEAA